MNTLYHDFQKSKVIIIFDIDFSLCYNFFMEKIVIKRYDSLKSTNITAKELAENNAPEGTIVVANHQTQGYGRYKRSFFSPEDTGLYFSLILRPQCTPEASLLITTAAAVAVAEAIETLTGKNAQIKWVNDIIIEGKKVCGILTEGSLSSEGNLRYAILGIGVNISEPKLGFPCEIKDIAGAISNKDIKEDLLNETLTNFAKYYNDLLSNTHYSEYRRRSCVLGKEVQVTREEKHFTALATDIDTNYNLVLQFADKHTQTLNCGEISVKVTNND